MIPKTKDIINELKVCQWLEISSEQLERLRRENKFPYYKIHTRHRLYSSIDIMNWLKIQKVGLE